MHVTRISRYTVYSVRYYPRFHITAIGLGTYYPWIRGHYCRWEIARSLSVTCFFAYQKPYLLQLVHMLLTAVLGAAVRWLYQPHNRGPHAAEVPCLYKNGFHTSMYPPSRRTRRKGKFTHTHTHTRPFSCRAHAVPGPCRAA
jgi:hypothetical protein